MDITEEIREEFKTGDDSTGTENSKKSKINKRSEPSLDKPNPKDMKITLPLSKSDDHSFSKCLDYHKKITKFLRRKNQRQYSNL